MATSDALRKALQTAFATGDLLRICEAIDRSIVNFSSVTEVSKAAQIDRTTLYRAFRIKKGPALQTMIRVLHVLGFRLAVEVKKDSKNNANATRTARAISKALKIGNMELLSQALAITACEQENVTAFAKEAHMSREWVYRLFAGTRLLRFGTLLSYLNALGGATVLHRANRKNFETAVTGIIRVKQKRRAEIPKLTIAYRTQTKSLLRLKTSANVSLSRQS